MRLFFLSLVPVTMAAAPYHMLNSGATNPSGYTCQQTVGVAIDNTKSGMVTPHSNGNYYYWPLDSNGALNYHTLAADDTGLNSIMSDTYDDSEYDTSGVPRNVEHGLWSGETGAAAVAKCKERCDTSDNCVAMTFNHHSDFSWNCVLMAACQAHQGVKINVGDYVDTEVKLGYSGVNFTNAYPFTTCLESPIEVASWLGRESNSNKQQAVVNPQVCYDHCKTKSGATYIAINNKLQCECYTACTRTTWNGATGASELRANQIVYQMPAPQAPTKSPTVSPTGTVPTTKSPTKSPTSQPTRSPLGAGQTHSPTKSPTAGPTEKPKLRTLDYLVLILGPIVLLACCGSAFYFGCHLYEPYEPKEPKKKDANYTPLSPFDY